jgi:predicted amidohydrolase YtcJ
MFMVKLWGFMFSKTVKIFTLYCIILCISTGSKQNFVNWEKILIMEDAVVYNAKVYLERGYFAEAVLVHSGKIVAVGDNETIRSQAPGVGKIDAGGGLLLPGFNDSHLHLHDFGRNIHRIQAYGVSSIDELVARGRDLIDRIKPPKGSVVSGTGWNQDLFTGDKRLPNRHDIDRISTEHAVVISRVCGHSLCCNSLALKMAGITRDYAANGHIEPDENGEPLGIAGEGAALYKIRDIIPPFNQEQIEEQLLYAARHALKNGLTSAGSRDIIEGNYQSIVDAYIKLFTEDDLHLRISLQCTIESDAVFNEFIKRGWITGSSMGHPYLTMGASKLFADGSLGSRTAYMREPYMDAPYIDASYMGASYMGAPSTRGYQIHPQEELDALALKNHKNGFQVIIHAIGDAAIEEVLNSFAKATGGHSNKLRHGIVHCQITDLPLLRRMADNDILAFMQPIFLTHDLYIIENRVGKELASTSYALATMHKLGVKAVYGTDSPVESMSPIECIDCAVNRHDVANGYPEEGFYPGECVDVYPAVDAYTLGGAYAEFAENNKGRSKPGYLADMTLLDRDIFTIPRKEIRRARVLWTMVGGVMAYRSD